MDSLESPQTSGRPDWLRELGSCSPIRGFVRQDVRATCAGYECSQGRSVRRKTCEVQDTPQGAYRVCSETVRCFRVCAGREQEVSTSVTETREPILPHSQPGGVSADDVSGMLSEFFAFAKEVQHDFISSAGCAKAEGLTPPAHTQGLLGRWFNSKHAGSGGWQAGTSATDTVPGSRTRVGCPMADEVGWKLRARSAGQRVSCTCACVAYPKRPI
ncbi:hypothetical protein V8C86DRAFT_791145 [Haematococcus lacustris]